METIESDCNKALEDIRENIGTANAIIIEQKLWPSIQKTYKSNNSNPIVMNYFIGYYNAMYEIIFLNSQSKDPYLNYSRYGFETSSSSSSLSSAANLNHKLLYNIHIRLGDLYRYGDSYDNAKYYYKRALHLDPRRGFAYNQLALSTPLTKAYQCVYYYVRALYSTEEPFKVAESNIKVSISRFDSPLFERFRRQSNISMSDNAITIAYPSNGQEWFYLVVISIHFNDLNLTLDLLLDQLLKTIDCDDESLQFDYLLMSLDVAFDWILKDRNNQLANDTTSTQKAHLLNDNLKTLNVWLLSNSKLNDNIDDDRKNETDCNIGLIHNTILKDFSPLRQIYDQMEYYYETEMYRMDKHRKILISRLVQKLQKF
ncbi:hypothetical protein DERP_003846 [Dermatophagoides pteronyssinus]|uniref:DNA/RNA-binding domain-containing protein n=1 Tax=Dermatophagoides pteronyssinus TaxID=6956 RepID=A0ABQ8J7H7_DERPT|nr:hypothetical protein DERP_003846 [Dermatophagoides pteronyssinus]